MHAGQVRQDDVEIQGVAMVVLGVSHDSYSDDVSVVSLEVTTTARTCH